MNITGDRVGVPLSLTLTIETAQTCAPLAGAEIDLWSADANGAYSGYDDFGTQGQDWLRGQLITNDSGMVTFDAIVPGSYPGRAVHLHVKVRAPGLPELTTQVYLPNDAVSTVLALPGYQGAAHTTNEADAFFSGDTLLSLSGDINAGYSAAGTLYV
jgi:protocatechuate 3,4-dioxygenase beta subunit